LAFRRRPGLAQAAIYLAISPKSDAGYQALNRVKEAVEETVAEPVPLQLRNAVTSSMREWGYGEGYQHAHQFQDASPICSACHPRWRGAGFYLPTDRGLEKRIAERPGGDSEGPRDLAARRGENLKQFLDGSAIVLKKGMPQADSTISVPWCQRLN